MKEIIQEFVSILNDKVMFLDFQTSFHVNILYDKCCTNFSTRKCIVSKESNFVNHFIVSGLVQFNVLVST